MVSASNIYMLSRNDGLQGFDCSLEDNSQSELELLLRSQCSQLGLDQEAELNVCGSGSAPPTVEGLCCAIGGLLENSSHFRDVSSNLNGISWEFANEGDARSPPVCSYYYFSENLNPRLPSPFMLKENCRVSQSFQVGGSSFGGVRDSRDSLLVEDGNNSSLFSIQPGACGLSVQDATNELMQLRQVNRLASVEWLGRRLNGLNGQSVSSMGARTKSSTDILQDGSHPCSSLSSLFPRPQSCNALGDTLDPIIAALRRVDISPRVVSSDGLYPRAGSPGMTTVPSRCISAPIAPSFSRNMSIEAKLAGMPCSSNFPIVDGRDSAGGLTIQSGHSPNNTRIDDILASFSDMNMSKYRESDEERLLQSRLHMAVDNQMDNYCERPNLKVPPGFGSSSDLARKNECLTGLGSPGINTGGNSDFPKQSSSASLYSKLTASDIESIDGYSDQFQQGSNVLNTDLTGHHVSSRYSLNEDLNSNFGHGFTTGLSQLNPINREIMQRYEHELINNLSHVQYMPSSLTYIRKAYLEAIVARQKEQDSLRMGKLTTVMDHKHQGSLSLRLRTQYSGAEPANSGLSPVGYGWHVSHDERVARISSLMMSSMGDMKNSWPLAAGANGEGRFVSSVLDEFKNSKTMSFELADISSHVVEFSSDQYGSRFIQQKLETASEEEKEKIFPSILPHARSLMTDAFGNYVIQKFFECGTESQRKELAGQLAGHVLPLSLQMYGCRVIQKALEVVDVEQQTEMVAGLDGSTMKCVRDQNGNHVIQECIECIPQDRIQFMISAFFGQVVPLSMHPYGCRVIQRVLEYCDIPNTQETVIKEIMQSCILSRAGSIWKLRHSALEHGKPHERATIIAKLSGHFVKMSQQKFASNVVEKCLTFGSSEEHHSLIQEMLGSTDENKPLQVMMKYPFGNYVVQKVLEICNDRTLEFILPALRST